MECINYLTPTERSYSYGKQKHVWFSCLYPYGKQNHVWF